jgi:biotin carboxylase
MEKRVLLVATTIGYQIRSFGEAARKLGVRLMFVTDRCDRLDDPWRDQAIAVRFHDEDRSVEAVVAACGSAVPDGVVAVGDRPAVLAARLAGAFGFSWHPPDAARISRNKLFARRAFKSAGLPTPRFRTVSLDDEVRSRVASFPYPAVVKPLALSGSRGVMRVDNPDQCVDALRRLRRLLASPDVLVERDHVHRRALVESFISGPEYAVEGILEHGRFHPLAIFDKPDPLDGPFFEETIYLAPSLAADDVQQRILECVADGARAIGLHHGPVHAECRVSGSSVYLLEVAARPIGGLCSRSLRFVNDQTDETVTLEEVVLRHALGERVDAYRREPLASGVMMIPIARRGIFRSAEGIDNARGVPGVEDVRITAKRGALVVPLPEGRSYLGFIFARGSGPGLVERSLRAAHERLHFVLDRELPVIG